MEFCEKLIRLRKTHHMTQEDLAQALQNHSKGCT